MPGIQATTNRHATRRPTRTDLFFRATHDPLTGLANRWLLEDRMEHAVARLRREPKLAAVLFVDLDGFKQVNDTHDHATGDRVLRVVAEALVAAVRPSDTVARVGGDEFVVVCERLGAEAEALEVAERVRAGIDAAIAAEVTDVPVTVSVGVALASVPETTAELIDRADRAMYRAKAAGGDRVVVTRPE